MGISTNTVGIETDDGRLIGGHAHRLGECGIFGKKSLNKCQNFKNSPYNNAFFYQKSPYMRDIS